MYKLTIIIFSHKLSTLQNTNNTMNTPVEQLLKSMEELSSMFTNRMGEFEKNLPQPGTITTNTSLKTLSGDYYSFKTFVWKSLGMLKSQVELVVLGMDRLETHSRRKVLLFHGIKESKDEDIMKKTVAVLTNQMKMSDISQNTIESCHRLGDKKDASRPVLVRFSTVKLRSMIWKAKTTLKGSKISLTEFLTKSRQEVFKAARDHFGMKKCWSADGVIIVLLPDHTRVKISSCFDLKQLITKHPKNADK